MAPWPHGKFRTALFSLRAALMRPLEDGDIFPRGAIHGALAAHEIPNRVITQGPH